MITNNQPNIIYQYCSLMLFHVFQHNLPPQPIGSKYTSDGDKLILEDELQRIILVGELKVQSSVTGSVEFPST